MTRILIVEDEPSLAEPLAFLLEREGYETAIASDGRAALTAFDSHGADLVLLDLMLPGLPGTVSLFSPSPQVGLGTDLRAFGGVDP